MPLADVAQAHNAVRLRVVDKTTDTGAARVMFFLATMHDRSYARHVAAADAVPDAELDDVGHHSWNCD
jgi:hypothetical protein